VNQPKNKQTKSSKKDLISDKLATYIGRKAEKHGLHDKGKNLVGT